MAISWTDVTNIAPSLSAVPGAAQTAILAYVALQVGSNQWGDWRDMGSVYLAAHLGTLELRGTGGASGQVTSETVGSVSRTFATTATEAAAELGGTSYGAEYARLRRLLPTRFGLLA